MTQADAVAIDRLRDEIGTPFGCFAGEPDNTLALVHIEDAQALITAYESQAERLREVEGALGDYDETIAPCPINGPKPPKRREACPDCGATSSQACGRERSASYRLVNAVRALTQSPTENGE